MHPAPRLDQVREQRRLSHARGRLHDEVAGRVGGQEVVELRDQGLAPDEGADVDAVEHLAGIDVRLGQALVAAEEERIAIARDDQVREDVAARRHRAAVGAHRGGHASNSRERGAPLSTGATKPPSSGPGS
jgi:hypothetical protein